MDKKIVQKMEFVIPDTEKAKEEFTRWVSTCPKDVRGTYLRGTGLKRCKYLYADWCHHPEHCERELQEQCAWYQHQELCCDYVEG